MIEREEKADSGLAGGKDDARPDQGQGESDAPSGEEADAGGSKPLDVDKWLKIAIVVLALAGIAIAGYLTWVHYAGSEPLCLASGGCEKVQNSEWAKLAGVPVALIGLIGYVAILAVLFIPGEIGKVLVAGMALVGFAFSAYLTYRELFDIEAICQWCVASATVMSVIACLSVWRLLRTG